MLSSDIAFMFRVKELAADESAFKSTFLRREER